MDRAEWLAERRKGIGASDVAPILGLSKFRTALDVYLEKIGHAPEDDTNAAQKRRGLRLQRGIIDEYCEEQGVSLVAYEPPITRHPDNGIYLCSLDAVVANTDSDEHNVDAKALSWMERSEWGEEESDRVPDDYFWQLHWQNFVTRRYKSELAVDAGQFPLRVYTIPRDDEMVELILDDLEKFWLLVQANTPPEPDFAHKTTTALMQRLYPDVDLAKEIMIDGKYHDLALHYYGLGRVESAADKRRKAMKGELLFIAGDAAIAYIKDSPFYLARVPVKPRRCPSCGYAKSEQGSIRLDVKLQKGAPVPALPQAISLIEGETNG